MAEWPTVNTYGQGEHAVSKDTQKDNGFFSDAESFTPQVSNIPLEDAAAGRTPGIGELVRDASTQVSSLIRSETELAKTEIAGSAKKAGIAAGLLGGAGVILAYSSFFFFFLAELLDNWMPRWVAFLVVFLIMFVLVVVLALVAVKFIKGVKKPEATIDSVGKLKTVIPSSGSSASSSDDAGMFT
jgi:hypothetical protein